MNRKTVLFVAILIYLLACGKSCDEGEQRESAREKASTGATIDSLKTVFESDALSLEMLQAFEASAMMKFRDFTDYYRIACDPSAAEIFREQARKMASSSFLKAEDYPGMVPFEADSVSIGVPFYKINDTLYEGELNFTMTRTRFVGNDSIEYRASGTAGIFLARHPKPFGSDTLKVWDVFLGKIKVVF